MAPVGSTPAATATLPDGAERFLGLPAADAVDLRQQLELSPQQCALLLGIPARTVARRKEARQLNPQELDRLYRLARATAHVVAVLGSLDHARLWFWAPN